VGFTTALESKATIVNGNTIESDTAQTTRRVTNITSKPGQLGMESNIISPRQKVFKWRVDAAGSGTIRYIMLRVSLQNNLNELILINVQ
jgi:hypothetical protein